MKFCPTDNATSVSVFTGSMLTYLKLSTQCQWMPVQNSVLITSQYQS